MKPCISIIVPAYQAEGTLARLIKSIQDQTFTNWELIVINDGSTDRTEQILIDWTTRDSRITLISQPNRGVSSARNTGIESAQGEWIFFADSDDYLPEDALKQLLCNGESADLICGGFNSPNKKQIIDGEVAHWPAQDLLQMIVNPAKYNSISRSSTNFDELFERSPCGKLYRTSILKNYAVRFNTNLIIGEDALFNIQYLSNAQTVCTVNAMTYFYDRSVSANTSNYSKKVVAKLIENTPTVFDSLLPLVSSNVVTQDDAYHYLADEAMRVFRRAAREAPNLAMAAQDIEMIRADPLLNKALSHYHRPGKMGDLVNQCYIRLIKTRHILLALRIERMSTQLYRLLPLK